MKITHEFLDQCEKTIGDSSYEPWDDETVGSLIRLCREALNIRDDCRKDRPIMSRELLNIADQIDNAANGVKP